MDFKKSVWIFSNICSNYKVIVPRQFYLKCLLIFTLDNGQKMPKMWINLILGIYTYTMTKLYNPYENKITESYDYIPA